MKAASERPDILVETAFKDRCGRLWSDDLWTSDEVSACCFAERSLYEVGLPVVIRQLEP